MKLFLPVFFFSLFFSFQLFSQNKIGQITYAQWDTEVEKWNYYSFDKWTYDDQKRENLFSHIDSREGVYMPMNNLKSSSTYDDAGNLKEKYNYNYGPDMWSNEMIEYSYDADAELKEQLITGTYSNNDCISQRKYIFEKDEIENRRTTKLYVKNEAGNFILRTQRDSFFTVQNCLKKEIAFNFTIGGTIQDGGIWEKEYNADCQLSTAHFYKWNFAMAKMKEFAKYIYEYSNDGKMEVVTYFKFDQSANQWEMKNVSEKEFDQNEQRVRYFVETYAYNSIDSILILNTYTSKGEVETQERYETRNFANTGRYFGHIQSDSFSYHYDVNDQLILKEEYTQNYDNLIGKHFTTYEYYCNGQLKSEIHGGEYPYSRKDYEYYGGVDCPLGEEEKKLLLFPNPTKGRFTIQSNLLSNTATTIQVFTILGQEIFFQKINQVSYQYQLDLSNFGKGNYIITVSNEQGRVSEKLIVFD